MAASLAVWGVWAPDFNGFVSGVTNDGKIKINGYMTNTPMNGSVWVALAGIIKVQ